MKPHKTQSAGFTVLEIVIVILSLLMLYYIATHWIFPVVGWVVKLVFWVVLIGGTALWAWTKFGSKKT